MALKVSVLNKNIRSTTDYRSRRELLERLGDIIWDWTGRSFHNGAPDAILLILSDNALSEEHMSILELAKQRKIPVVVEIPKDMPVAALQLIRLGAYWVVPGRPFVPDRIGEVLRAASREYDRRMSLCEKIENADGQLSRTGAANVFVSMSYDQAHEDRYAYKALRESGPGFGAKIRSSNEYDGEQGSIELSSKVFAQIDHCDYFLAFLAPGGRPYHREYISRLLSYVSSNMISLRPEAVSDLRPRKMAVEENILNQPLGLNADSLFSVSPNVMLEVGYAIAKGKRCIFCTRSDYRGVSAHVPAMARGATRLDYYCHIELVLKMYFGFVGDSSPE